MDLPAFPDSLVNRINTIDRFGKEIKWKLTETDDRKITLQIIWTMVQKLPPDDVTLQQIRDNNNNNRRAAAVRKEPNHVSEKNKYKKRKSPCRLARDRRRLLEFMKGRSRLQKKSGHDQEKVWIPNISAPVFIPAQKETPGPSPRPEEQAVKIMDTVTPEDDTRSSASCADSWTQHSKFTITHFKPTDPQPYPSHFQAKLDNLYSISMTEDEIPLDEDQLKDLPCDTSLLKSWSYPMDPTDTIGEHKSHLYGLLRYGLDLPIPSVSYIHFKIPSTDPTSSQTELRDHENVMDIILDNRVLFDVGLDLCAVEDAWDSDSQSGEESDTL